MKRQDWVTLKYNVATIFYQVSLQKAIASARLQLCAVAIKDNISRKLGNVPWFISGDHWLGLMGFQHDKSLPRVAKTE